MMGIDLTLYIAKYYNVSWSTYDNISLDRHYDLFEMISPNFRGSVNSALEPAPLPSGAKFSRYSDDGIKRVSVDAYGDKLTYLTAGQFKNLPDIETSRWNIAVLAFLKTLPQNIPVILYWH